ncbi:MAG: hypothetical protein ACLFQO_08490 [Cyclobacteriaceae bacterium]
MFKKQVNDLFSLDPGLIDQGQVIGIAYILIGLGSINFEPGGEPLSPVGIGCFQVFYLVIQDVKS